MTGVLINEKKKFLRDLAMKIGLRRDWWLYPSEPMVEGFLGVGPIFIVGDQPSTSAWEHQHPHRRAFYDLLASEGAGESHLTDIYKRRGPSGELRKGLQQDFEEHLEIFRAEVNLLNPSAIVVLGWDAYELLLKHTPELTNRLIRVWHFGTVRHGKVGEFRIRLKNGIAQARRMARPAASVNLYRDDKKNANVKNMKTSRLNPDTHVGKQPIRVLKFNILHQLEHTHEGFMVEYTALLKKHGLNPSINYDYTEGPLFNLMDPSKCLTPFVDGNKEITIQETFLSYLWAMCYSILVIHEEHFHKPMLNRINNGKHQIDHVSLDAAYKLHRYGLSLINAYEPWDKKALPNPEEYSEAETFYVEKANGVFRTAAAFIICHEIAHIKLGHLETIGTYVATADRKLEEIQADHDAFFTMIKGANDEIGKINYGVGMLIGFCSILLLQSKLPSRTHPDSDDRVEGVLRQLELDDVSPLWGMASMSLKLWDEYYEKKLTWPKEVEHVKALFYSIHDQLKASK